MSALPPSMSDRDGKIWMDGQMVDWRDAKIHVLSHTLHYGCGAFDDGFVTGAEYFDDWELWADSGEVLAWKPLSKAYKAYKKKRSCAK